MACLYENTDIVIYSRNSVPKSMIQNNKNKKANQGNIPIDTLRQIVNKTVEQNPVVFERLAEI